MCERFQKKFLDSVMEKIKGDTFALDILKEKLGVDLVECPYKLKDCKVFFLEATRSNNFVKIGFKCSGCNIKMCESCKKYKSVKSKCLNCVVKEKAKKSTSKISEIACPNCDGMLSVSDSFVDFLCVNCKIVVDKPKLRKKNIQNVLVMLDDQDNKMLEENEESIGTIGIYESDESRSSESDSE